MSKETANSLFIGSSRARFYQTLFTGVGNYGALGSRIVKQIKTAQAFRQTEPIRELATILSNVPIKEYQVIGQYYLVWCDCRESAFKAEALERLAEQTRTYKAKVLSSRAFIEGCQNKMEAALYFYNEAMKASRVISDYINIKLGVAQVKGLEGFHQSALNDLETLIPIIRYVEPRLFFNTLNSYATELGEVGRLYEARNVSRLVLSSPLAYAYPEWQQTASDLQGPSRSVVQVTDFDASPENVLSLPPAPERVVQSPPSRPGKLLDYMRYKKKIAKKKKDEPEENIDLMDKKDLLVKLLELAAQDHTDEEELRQVVKCAVEIMEKKK